MNKTYCPILFLLISFCQTASAEIDKIYHPYVEAYKSEIEYRMLYKNDPASHIDGTQYHRLSFGHSLTERFSMEAYVIGKNLPTKSFSVDAYELEAKLQLTEQGEYWSDWGLLFELERDTDVNKWETGLGLLWEKEWGNIITSANFFIDYETGSGVMDEFETAFHSQVKYRWSRYFEPAIELYMDEETRGLGPAFLGSQKIGINNLNWELGFIFGFNDKTANQNLRFLLDYEF
jgi:hypothetical protein